jgi:pimeloyl-ACP methyl ester carboxylesterase
MANILRVKSPKKSTIDRTFDRIRLAFRPLDRLSPALAGDVAELLFFTPARSRRTAEPAVFTQARRLPIQVDGRPVAAWRWGHGPVVLLLHGWSGRGAQLAAFVTPLLAQGYSVVALDAPGHGASGRYRSSAPQFAAGVQAVAQAVGPLAGVIAHSLGAAGAALAMADGVAVDRLVLIAPAADPPAWLPPFAARLGLSAAAVTRLRARSERRIGRSWNDLHVPTLVAASATPLLVIHDRDDREVPWSDGAAIAAARPDAELLSTSGLGHVRLLQDAKVIDAAVEFLSRGANRCQGFGCGIPVPRPATHCHRCQLELDLFEPATRWTSREVSALAR